KNGTVNAHSVTSRMMNGTPFTGAMSAHIENIRPQNGPGAAYVQANVTERRSSGYASANSWAIMPPIDTPTMSTFVIPRLSMSAFVSCANWRVVYGPAGAELEPTPRLS